MTINLEIIFDQSRYKNAKFLIILSACGLDLMALGSMVVLSTDVKERFGISQVESGWALTAYSIALAGFIALLGRVGDIVGHGVMMSLCTATFSLFSLLCAVVPNFTAFTVFRALQGLSGAGIVPSSYALVAFMFYGPNLQRYFSILSTLLSGIIGVGYIVGGAFGETKIGYKSMFYFLAGGALVPATILTLTLGYPEFRANRGLYREKFSKVMKLDIFGCLLFIAGSILMVVGLTKGGESWKKPVAYVPLVVGVLLFIIFFFWNIYYNTIVNSLEHVTDKRTISYLKSVHLLLPKELLFSHNFVGVLSFVFFSFSSFMASLYVVVNYSRTVESNSEILSSIKVLPLIVGLLIGNSTVAIKQDLFRPITGVRVGLLLGTVAILLMIPLKYVTGNVFWKAFFLPMFFMGIGGSIMFSYMLTIAIGDAPDEFKALAAGVVQTFGQLGTELAFSIIISILGNSSNISRAKDRYQDTIYYMLASIILSLVCAFVAVRFKDEDQVADAEKCSNETNSTVDVQDVVDNKSDKTEMAPKV